MRKPVRRERLDRHQAAEKLVLALGAAFEGFELFGDRILDRLVVAAFEVQERHILHRTPVAAVEGMRVVDEKRRRERPAGALGYQNRRVLSQRGAQTQEK